MKGLYTSVVVVVIFSGWLNIASAQVIDFPDTNLAAAIREELDLAPDVSITAGDLRRLTTLAAVNRQITDLTGLENASQLENLYLSYNGISELSPLFNLTQLKILSLNFNEIRDVGPLAALKQLERLELWGNQINNVMPLTSLTQLEYLDLEGNQINDVIPLAGLTQLRWLFLAENQISDINPLTSLTQLEWLGLSENQISDVGPLADLTRLELLYLDSNQISDVSSLAGLTRLRQLRLAENQIRDVNPLTNLVNLIALSLDGNPITDLSSLQVFIRHVRFSQTDIDIRIDKPASVLIYTGFTWWINRNAAIAEAETTRNLLLSAGIDAEIAQNVDYVKQWMQQTASDGAVDVLIFYGILPSTIYAPGNAMPDGSVAENWIETTDGNTLLNHGDYLGYGSFWINDNNETDHTHNGHGTLQNLMDIPNIFIPSRPGDDNIPMSVTTDGGTLTPSLANFESDRPFPLDQLEGDWYPEKILASNTGDTQATSADPVLLRDGELGRIAIVYQTQFEDNPKGEVAAELIINYLLAEPAILAADINDDGRMNIQDLVFVASHLGETGENAADVNGDEIVDVRDLIEVAGALDTSAAAPSLDPQFHSLFGAADVRKWLSEAQHLNLTDPTSQRGIRFLEQLLAALVPQETALLPNYPNPFNPETWIPYQLAKPADVTLTIYAANGQVVRQLPLGPQATGIYQSKNRAVYWDGKNAVGERVASGVYFYTLTAGNFTATRKMLIRK